MSIVGGNRHVDIVGGDGFGDEGSVMREDSIQGVVEGDGWEVGSLSRIERTLLAMQMAAEERNQEHTMSPGA